LGIQDFVILDQNDDVGGVWLVNTYPGCASDAPSHLYSYSFEMNPGKIILISHSTYGLVHFNPRFSTCADWAGNYATQSEILNYLQNVSRKYKLYENINFHTRVDEILWDEGRSQWRVTVFDKKRRMAMEYFFDIL